LICCASIHGIASSAYLFYLAENEISPELRQTVGVSDLVQSACLDIYPRLADFRGQTVEQWRVWLKRDQSEEAARKL
jgi:hypothetical protein